MLPNLPVELWQSLWLTLKLATVTTMVLLMVGIPLAWWLVTSRFRGILFIETLVAMPIVLPPTVIGFYLLIALSPQHPIGDWWLRIFGHSLSFSFSSLVIGSVIYSLPFAVQPFQTAFRGVQKGMIDAALSLGMTKRQVFLLVILPLSKYGILTGAALSFAHTIGEFGVVLMLGGNLPGETRVASIALYDETQKLNYAVAHSYAAVLLTVSFVMLFFITWLQRRSAVTKGLTTLRF